MNARIAFASVAAVLLVACTTARLEALPDGPMGRGFRVGMVLELAVDRLVFPSPGWGTNTLYLDRRAGYEDHGFLGINSRYIEVTIEEYKNDPAAFPRVQLAPAGTRFVVSRITRQHWLGFSDPQYTVFVRATSGSLAGKEMEARVLRAPPSTPLVDPNEFKIIE